MWHDGSEPSQEDGEFGQSIKMDVKDSTALGESSFTRAEPSHRTHCCVLRRIRDTRS
jgi:hypothetical protein